MAAKQPPPSIQQQPGGYGKGRGQFHVIDSNGQVIGKHNSVWSAARQIHDYFPDGGEEGSEPGMSANHEEAESEAGVTGEAEPVGSRDIRPHVPRPAIPRPPKSEHPKPDTKRIPRP